MAREDRPATPALAASDAAVDALLRDPGSHAFFQALRLLRLRMADTQALRDAVRVRPALSLAFPDSDVADITQDEDGRYRIEANFFGLYGVTSPLPTYYTEDLIDESQQGNTVTRDFLDILHAALYPVLFAAWEKYRIALAVIEHRDPHRLQQLRALVGLAGPGARGELDATAMLPYAGNLSWRPRSALGLQGLLSGMLDGVAVQVKPCVTDTVIIPPDARGCLGVQAVSLGEDALIGQQMQDRAGNLAILVGPLSAEAYHALLPGTPGHDRLTGAIALYLETPLRCQLGLILAGEAREAAGMGGGWQQLGFDTWLGAPTPEPDHHEPPVWFSLALGAHRDPGAPLPSAFRFPSSSRSVQS